MTLPGTAAIPAVHADRLRAAEATGARAAALVGADLTPDADHHAGLDRERRSACCWRIGGSTNGVIHLTAIAGRLGIKLDLDAPQRALRHDAGAGRPQAGRQRLHGGLLRRRRHRRGAARAEAAARTSTCMTVTGETLGERLAAAGRSGRPRASSRPLADPIEPQGGLVALFGSLAPDGAILKRSAADASAVRARRPRRRLHLARRPRRAHRRSRPRRDAGRHPGPAERRPAQRRRPCPRPATCRSRRSCARAGVKDMVRISDARMTGTAYGTIVLHVTPEAAIGGPLALVRDRRPHPPQRRGRSASTCWSTKPSWPRRRDAAQAPSRGAAAARAATTGSTASTCCRPTTAATSTSA